MKPTHKQMIAPVLKKEASGYWWIKHGGDWCVSLLEFTQSPDPDRGDSIYARVLVKDGGVCAFRIRSENMHDIEWGGRLAPPEY